MNYNKLCDLQVSEKIATCCVSTLRKTIVDRTLATFYKNLFNGEKTPLFLNIDPAGCDGETTHDIFLTAKKYFKIYSWFSPAYPSFPKAFRRIINACVSAKFSKYILFLEDDWELVQKININEILVIMDRHDDLALLRLPRWQSGSDSTRQWNKTIPWNGEFFEVPENLRKTIGFSGNPSIIRSDFLFSFLSFLDPESDPEKFCKSKPFAPLYRDYRFGVFQHPNESAYVKDIGTRWREEKKIKKDSRSNFKTWQFEERKETCKKKN